MSQPLPTTQAEAAAVKLAGAMQQAVDLLRHAGYAPAARSRSERSPAALLHQCLAQCEQQLLKPAEPLRLVHHLACTGGTVISRCISAMANVQLLSGMDPLSAQSSKAQRLALATADRALALRGSSRGVSQDLVVALFQSELRLIYGDALRQGQRLVIRDNAQAHFCGPADPAQRPALRTMLPAGMPVRAVVVARNPLDSFLALRARDGREFDSQDFDDYCRRCLAFIDSHDGTTIVRYEDFVEKPEACIRVVCDSLELPFGEGFSDLAAIFVHADLRGIGQPSVLDADHEIHDQWHKAALRSDSCQRLLARMAYPRRRND
jgi:hypothetical protein